MGLREASQLPHRTSAPVLLLELLGARVSWITSALARSCLPVSDDIGLRAAGEDKAACRWYPREYVEAEKSIAGVMTR